MVTFKKKRGIGGFRGAVLKGGNYISVIWAMKYIQLYSDLSLSFYTNMCVCTLYTQMYILSLCDLCNVKSQFKTNQMYKNILQN